MSVDNMQDVIDSRDVIARIEELQSEHDKWIFESFDNYSEDWEDINELDTLRELAKKAGDSPDWIYGEALVRDTYFKQYAMELAEDCDMVDSNATWPNNCIDWEKAAAELKRYYFCVDFDGIDYWIKD